MSKSSPRRRLIIGVGNPDRGDDGVGHVVVAALQDMSLQDTELLTISGEATQLIEAWASADRVVVIDASCSGAKPGAIRRFDANAGGLPAALERASTHGFGVAEAVALARNLDRLPRHLEIYAVEGERFEFGATLTAEVAAAAQALAEQLADGARLPVAP